MKFWKNIKIIFWSLIWFAATLLLVLNIILFKLPAKLRNLAYQKIYFIGLIEARKTTLANLKNKYANEQIENQKFAKDIFQEIYKGGTK